MKRFPANRAGTPRRLELAPQGGATRHGRGVVCVGRPRLFSSKPVHGYRSRCSPRQELLGFARSFESPPDTGRRGIGCGSSFGAGIGVMSRSGQAWPDRPTGPLTARLRRQPRVSKSSPEPFGREFPCAFSNDPRAASSVHGGSEIADTPNTPALTALGQFPGSPDRPFGVSSALSCPHSICGGSRASAH